VGLEAQEAKCRELCAMRGWSIVSVHSDEGISGRKDVDDRPGLRTALETVQTYVGRRGGRAALVAYSVSRVARSQRVLWKLLDADGRRPLALVSATEPFDTSTAVGRAMLGMLGVWAQLEADMTSQRTKDALAVVKASGKRLGAPRAVDLSPALVVRVAKLREQGLTLRAIAAKLNEDGVSGARGGKWWTKTVAAALDQAAAATVNDNRQRRDARCPVHGCSLGQIGVWQRGNRSGPTVGCPRKDCAYTEEVAG
jgi:DNA invertase Pin-like site-specific DNA recombinase